jgi:hypothetical protein
MIDDIDTWSVIPKGYVISYHDNKGTLILVLKKSYPWIKQIKESSEQVFSTEYEYWQYKLDVVFEPRSRMLYGCYPKNLIETDSYLAVDLIYDFPKTIDIKKMDNIFKPLNRLAILEGL